MFCRAMGAPRRRHPKIWLYIVTALALWPYPIHAHDIYTDLVDANGYSCCNSIDCHPVPYRHTSRGVQMLVDNHWIDIQRKRSSTVLLPMTTEQQAAGTGAESMQTSIGISPVVPSCPRTRPCSWGASRWTATNTRHSI
jgi:hypothetical protein